MLPELATDLSLEFSRQGPGSRTRACARVKTASAIDQCAPRLLSTALEEHEMMEHNISLYPTERELAGDGPSPLGREC